MGKASFVIFLLGVFFLASVTGFAAEAVAPQETGRQLVGSVIKRGVVNFFTSPGEVVRTAKTEKEAYPQIWPVTYVPRLFTNMAVRVGSSINDMAVMPWFVWATKDPRPITSFFDLPEYSWQQS